MAEQHVGRSLIDAAILLQQKFLTQHGVFTEAVVAALLAISAEAAPAADDVDAFGISLLQPGCGSSFFSCDDEAIGCCCGVADAFIAFNSFTQRASFVGIRIGALIISRSFKSC